MYICGAHEGLFGGWCKERFYVFVKGSPVSRRASLRRIPDCHGEPIIAQDARFFPLFLCPLPHPTPAFTHRLSLSFLTFSCGICMVPMVVRCPWSGIRGVFQTARGDAASGCGFLPGGGYPPRVRGDRCEQQRRGTITRRAVRGVASLRTLPLLGWCWYAGIAGCGNVGDLVLKSMSSHCNLVCSVSVTLC